MTLKFLTSDNQKIIFRYNLRSDEEAMKSNIRLEPLCREPCTFVKLRPNRDKQSVSPLDDSSREEEKDVNFTMDKNLTKYETSEKLGRLMQPKFLFLIHIILLVTRFLCNSKNVGKFYWSVLLK